MRVELHGSVVNSRCGVLSREGAHLPVSVLAQHARAAWRGATLAAVKGCNEAREDVAGGGSFAEGTAEGVERGAAGDRVGDLPGEAAAVARGLTVTGCGRALTILLRSGVGGINDVTGEGVAAEEIAMNGLPDAGCGFALNVPP